MLPPSVGRLRIASCRRPAITRSGMRKAAARLAPARWGRDQLAGSLIPATAVGGFLPAAELREWKAVEVFLVRSGVLPSTSMRPPRFLISAISRRITSLVRTRSPGFAFCREKVCEALLALAGLDFGLLDI